MDEEGDWFALSVHFQGDYERVNMCGLHNRNRLVQRIKIGMLVERA